MTTITIDTLQRRAEHIGRECPEYFLPWVGEAAPTNREWSPDMDAMLYDGIHPDSLERVKWDYDAQLFALAVIASRGEQ
jgi:hypothetical protein